MLHTKGLKYQLRTVLTCSIISHLLPLLQKSMRCKKPLRPIHTLEYRLKLGVFISLFWTFHHLSCSTLNNFRDDKLVIVTEEKVMQQTTCVLTSQTWLSSINNYICIHIYVCIEYVCERESIKIMYVYTMVLPYFKIKSL